MTVQAYGQHIIVALELRRERQTEAGIVLRAETDQRGLQVARVQSIPAKGPDSWKTRRWCSEYDVVEGTRVVIGETIGIPLGQLDGERDFYAIKPTPRGDKPDHRCKALVYPIEAILAEGVTLDEAAQVVRPGHGVTRREWE